MQWNCLRARARVCVRVCCFSVLSQSILFQFSSRWYLTLSASAVENLYAFHSSVPYVAFETRSFNPLTLLIVLCGSVVFAPYLLTAHAFHIEKV